MRASLSVEGRGNKQTSRSGVGQDLIDPLKFLLGKFQVLQRLHVFFHLLDIGRANQNARAAQRYFFFRER
jgi:hypothetical protein